MLGEIQRTFKRPECLVAGFGNQVSDAVAYKTVGVHPNYILIIKESILYMLSGKYKFTMESFYGNVEVLFPVVNVAKK